MSDEADITDLELDRELSALVDGELAPGREADLRARLAKEPALAERFAAFQSLSLAMQGAPERAVPADLAARLAARIAEDEEVAALPRAADDTPPADVISLGERRARLLRIGVPAVVALAAGLALYLVVGRSGVPQPLPAGPGGVPQSQSALEFAEREPQVDEPETTRDQLVTAPLTIADLTEPGLDSDLLEQPIEIEEPEPWRANVDSLELAMLPPEAALPDVPASELTPEAFDDLEAIGEDELALAAIAFDLELLRDYELIEQLELLEVMSELDAEAYEAEAAGASG